MERSPETYLGYKRQENFSSREAIRRDDVTRYSAPNTLDPDQWALSGSWQVGKEFAQLRSPGGKIVYHFQGRDLHLVLGANNGKPVRFRVTLDGAAPGNDHGTDIDAAGNGLISGQRLYQLIRQSGEIRDRTFRIEFLDKGAEAFAFTFG
jgi:hypothetical protein